MKRRHLLHTVATLPILSSGFALLSAPTKGAKAKAPRTIRRATACFIFRHGVFASARTGRCSLSLPHLAIQSPPSPQS
jgi:hypothetical protein